LIVAYRRQVETHRDIGLRHYVSEGQLRAIIDRTRQRLEADPQWSDRAAAHTVVRAILDCCYRSHREATTRLLVEKTPSHVFHAEQILEDFPEARLLHVVRDGRDVCVSLEMLARTQDWPPKTRESQINMWKSHVRKGLDVAADPRYAERVCQVRYEDLQADPAGELERVVGFAGLSAAPDLIRRLVEDNDFSHQRHTGPCRYARKGVVGDWQNHFTVEDAALFRELAGPLLQECGYAWGEWTPERLVLSQAG
jgi:hypothetical protein